VSKKVSDKKGIEISLLQLSVVADYPGIKKKARAIEDKCYDDMFNKLYALVEDKLKEMEKAKTDISKKLKL